MQNPFFFFPLSQFFPRKRFAKVSAAEASAVSARRIQRTSFDSWLSKISIEGFDGNQLVTELSNCLAPLFQNE
jgi:hypothetical protein